MDSLDRMEKLGQIKGMNEPQSEILCLSVRL
jgi:hypothetical protein